MVSIDWRGVSDELLLTEDDAEAVVHELAHAYDCIGKAAFKRVGSQKYVNEMIAKKYGSDDCEEANMSEIRVSAVTYHALAFLGLLEEKVTAREIWDNLRANLRGKWNSDHTYEETRALFDEALARHLNVRIGEVLATFLGQNYPLLPGSEAEDL